MILIDKIVAPSTDQWDFVINAIRNPLNSWGKSDSRTNTNIDRFVLGKNDRELAMKLSKSGTDHSKYLRMLPVMMVVEAPLYWWKEFDTYKIGTVSNSCSTMHTLHKRDLTINDFSGEKSAFNTNFLKSVIDEINSLRIKYLETNDKEYWWQMIQLLPSSFNQLRSISLNYEVLKNIYHARKNHKLDEWRDFCWVIEGLPFSELITMKEVKNDRQNKKMVK